MSEQKRKTKVKEKSEELAEQLNQVPFENVENRTTDTAVTETEKYNQMVDKFDADFKEQLKKDRAYQEEIKEARSQLFDHWDSEEFTPNDYRIEVPVDSLESAVGYSSLIRQLHDSFAGMVAFYRQDSGGSMSIEEAREKAFHRCENTEEAKKIFQKVMSYPFHNIFFSDLHSLYGYAPRVAERLWETVKDEAQTEFESGHLAANTMFPVHYMKSAWSIAKYLGLRESFIAEWQPRGGIELSLIDMLAQTFFQWQYWLEETIKRSQTRPREEHYEYQKWKQWNEKTKNSKSWQDGYWFPTYVSEQQDIEHAVQMADRFNRIYMPTLRQLRDLRRYAPVTINNPNQINIANDGGQQVNISNAEDDSKGR